ncbi:hypothetical protein [Neomoorella thermoacetica]|nr:hypothetical protein [Moorella thermoacetica]
MLPEEFALDLYGYAAIIRLVEKRGEMDISLTKKRRDAEIEKENSLRGKTDMFSGMRYNNTRGKRLKLDQEVHDKKRWLDAWLKKAWAAIDREHSFSFVEDLKSQPLERLLAQYDAPEEKRFKRYLIMQEAVLTPLYGRLEGLPDVKVSEIDKEAGLEFAARICSLPASAGKELLARTNAFIKEATNYWERLIKYTMAGTLALIVTAGLAAPALAGAVGAAMGLHGAAAFTAGLAFFGGGAVAAGGLGMAGGLTVLVGGGAVLGAVGGAGLAHILELPKETMLLSMAKLVNYVNYLTSLKPTIHSQTVTLSILEQFLRFKNQLETEMLCGSTVAKDSERGLVLSNTLNHTFEALYKTVVMGKR